MIETFDFLLTAIVCFSQARITVMLWRRAGARPWLHAAIILFDALALFGYACSFSYITGWLGIAGGPASILGAAALGYFITATCALGIYTILSAIRKRMGEPANLSRRRALNALTGALMAAPVAAIGYGTFIERQNVRIHEVDLPIPNLPHDLDGVRILQLSDIHVSPFLSVSDLGRALDAAIETKPDLAVVTGDLISSRGDPLDACIRQLARVKATAGVFGCLGNHEHYARAEDYCEQAAARVGIRFLRGQSVPLRFGNATLNLAGVDHQSSHAGQYLVGAERLVKPGEFNLLLSHNPDVLPVAAQKGYNLVLSGHTHGGQINIEIMDQNICPARFVTPYIHGLYRSGGAAGYVTRGIGTIGIPTRIGAPPEIPVLRLRKA